MRKGVSRPEFHLFKSLIFTQNEIFQARAETVKLPMIMRERLARVVVGSARCGRGGEAGRFLGLGEGGNMSSPRNLVLAQRQQRIHHLLWNIFRFCFILQNFLVFTIAIFGFSYFEWKMRVDIIDICKKYTKVFHVNHNPTCNQWCLYMLGFIHKLRNYGQIITILHTPKSYYGYSSYDYTITCNCKKQPTLFIVDTLCQGGQD